VFRVVICWFNVLVIRCTADAKDLDGEAGRRSHVHTDALLRRYNHKILWNDYGIVGDVIVSNILSFVT
jgi:hypothetical protein